LSQFNDLRLILKPQLKNEAVFEILSFVKIYLFWSDLSIVEVCVHKKTACIASG